MRLILASASRRRAVLLRAAGYAFEAIAVDVDERVRDGESPAAYVRRLAVDKSAGAASYVARAGGDLRRPWAKDAEGGASSAPARLRDDVVILGADTAVVVDGDILGKPRSDRDAAAMLRRLSGRRHEVLTGVSLRRGACEVGRVETTAVHFTRLTDTDVAWYVATGEGRDKAGAYAIQGLAARFIPRIEGSYSNVVGLPLACVHELLSGTFGVQPALRPG